MLPPNWNKLTSDEKFEARMTGWMSTEGKTFATPEIAKTYQRRIQRLKDIIQLKKPDRIPGVPIIGGYIAEYTGLTHGDFFYDYEKSAKAMLKFHADFMPDYQAAGNFNPGKVFDLLGYKVYRWPGGGLPSNTAFQCVEAEYMSADEYDQLIADPEAFYMRTYMPRVFSGLAGWQMLPSFYGTMELPMLPLSIIPYGLPPVQQAFKAYLDAAQANMEWLAVVGRMQGELITNYGLTGTAGGFTKAPFDIIGDTLRGTRGIMLDLFRQPAKVLAAVERLTPMAIEMGVSAANATGNPMILIPLHKGADGFMSNADFAKFYWPWLKATLLGLIEQGVVPFLFVEGGYNQRLDAIAASDLPKGKSVWMFDKSDMQAVKAKFGSWACFGGNVPASMFAAGTAQQITAYCRNLFDTVAQDGGFFLSPGAVLDHATPETMLAFIEAPRKYGVY